MSQRKVLTGSNATYTLNGQNIYVPSTSGTYIIESRCSCPIYVTRSLPAADEVRIADLFNLLHKLLHRDKYAA